MCPAFDQSCELRRFVPSALHPLDIVLTKSLPSSHSATSIAINPTALQPAYSFFSSVSDVASFDSAFNTYFNERNQFRYQKLHAGLQCNETGFLNATLQWVQTVLCGQFTSLSYNAGCTSGPNASSPLVCRDTCTQYSDSEERFVNNATYCTPTDALRPQSLATIRNNTLTNDHDSCTSWTQVYSANNATCISGPDNEGNCGFGNGINPQLCGYCTPGSGGGLPACCYSQKTDLSACGSIGYSAAALVSPASSSTGPSATGSSTSAPSGSNSAGASSGGSANRLSGGQIAGVVVGCVLGAIILGALVAWLLLACCNSGRRADDDEARAGIVAGAAKNDGNVPREKAFMSEDTGRHPSMSGEKATYSPPGMGGSGAAGGLAAGGLGAAAGGAALGAAAAGGQHQNDGSSNSRPISTATTGTDGRGTTVPSVRCQYTGQDIAPGDSVMAIYPYSAGLSDELDLTPETREELSVVRIYDDGWCLLRQSDGKEGAAPLVCCQSSKGELPAHMRMGDSTTGTGTGTGSGTTDDDAGGMTSGAEGGMTSSAAGAVTADEHGFTSDAASR